MVVARFLLYSFIVLVVVNFSPCSGMYKNKNKCKIENRIKLVLKTMNDNTVAAVVDCVVGVGDCDPTGQEIKEHAQEAVCTKCGSNCTCEQIQFRLIVLKMKNKFKDQWARVEELFKDTC